MKTKNLSLKTIVLPKGRRQLHILGYEKGIPKVVEQQRPQRKYASWFFTAFFSEQSKINDRKLQRGNYCLVLFFCGCFCHYLLPSLQFVWVVVGIRLRFVAAWYWFIVSCIFLSLTSSSNFCVKVVCPTDVAGILFRGRIFRKSRRIRFCTCTWTVEHRGSQ